MALSDKAVADKAVRVNTILEDAESLVGGVRQQDYGHPLEDFTRTARMWEGYLGLVPNTIVAEDVALMMQMVKQSRLRNAPDHRDSLVDVAGYARCYDLIIERRTIFGHAHPRYSRAEAAKV